MKKKEKEKITLHELREDAVLSASIPQYRAMGFKVDSKITSVSAELVAIIEYAIGGELKDLNEQIQNKINSIRMPLIAEIDLEALSDSEKAALYSKVNSALIADKELSELKEKEAALWDREVDKEEVAIIEIEEKEYAEKFSVEKKEISILYKQYSIDGYQALLAMIARGYIVIK